MSRTLAQDTLESEFGQQVPASESDLGRARSSPAQPSDKCRVDWSIGGAAMHKTKLVSTSMRLISIRPSTCTPRTHGHRNLNKCGQHSRDFVVPRRLFAKRARTISGHNGENTIGA